MGRIYPRKFSKAQLKKASRDRLMNPAPMRVSEYVAPKPEPQTEMLREAGAGTFVLWACDTFGAPDGGGGYRVGRFQDFEAAMRAAWKGAKPGYHVTIDNGAGVPVVRVRTAMWGEQGHPWLRSVVSQNGNKSLPFVILLTSLVPDTALA